MGETKSLRKLATEMSVAAKDCCSVSMVAISCDLAAGQYPEKPLERLRARNSLDRLWKLGLAWVAGPCVKGRFYAQDWNGPGRTWAFTNSGVP
jgi:hypothetical protein